MVAEVKGRAFLTSCAKTRRGFRCIVLRCLEAHIASFNTTCTEHHHNTTTTYHRAHHITGKSPFPSPPCAM